MDIVNKCPKSIKDKMTSADDVMISSCLKESTLHFEVSERSQACDADFRDLFEHENIVNLTDAFRSPNIVLGHHMSGVLRHHLYHSLYGSGSQATRLCVQTDVSLVKFTTSSSDASLAQRFERAGRKGKNCTASSVVHFD